MTAPANDNIRRGYRLQNIGIAQNVEYRIGNPLRRHQVEFRIVTDFVADINNVAQYREQMFMNAFDHLAIDKGAGRRPLDVKLDAALALDNADLERVITFKQLLAVIHVIAAIENGQRAIAEYFIKSAEPGVMQFRDFALGENFKMPFRGDLRIDHVIRQVIGISKGVLYWYVHDGECSANSARQ